MSGSNRGQDNKPRWVVPALVILALVLIAALAYVAWATSNNWNASQQNARQIQSNAQRYERERCVGLDVVGGIECITKTREAAAEKERDEADLYAQRQMAVWAFLVAITALVSIPLSLGGIFLLWQNLMQVHRSNESAEQSAEAALLSARAAVADLNPLIAFENATVRGAMVDSHEGRISIKIDAHNMGKSVARGFLLTVKHNFQAKTGMKEFITECRGLARDPETVLTQGLLAEHDEVIRVSRHTYNDWLESELKPYKDLIEHVDERNAAIIAEHGPDHNDRGRSAMEARMRLQTHEAGCRSFGMHLRLYVVATWIGIEPETVSFAAQEYRVFQIDMNGTEIGSFPMENEGQLRIGLARFGLQLVGPHIGEKKADGQQAA